MLEIMQPGEFKQVFSIIEQSFPIDEYRTFEEHKELLNEPEYCIYVQHATHGGNIQAFLAVWQFEDFTYIEHFAIDPALRGQGIGSAILQEVHQLFPRQICLEVELPRNNFAKRRISFYERNGFFLNDYPYMQPPLSKGKNELPLIIMTSKARIGKERFRQIQKKLYQKVYKVQQ